MRLYGFNPRAGWMARATGSEHWGQGVIDVSIHARAGWPARPRQCESSHRRAVSIHARAGWPARRRSRRSSRHRHGFNPRAGWMARATLHRPSPDLGLNVSIHARAGWPARPPVLVLARTYPEFQSTRGLDGPRDGAVRGMVLPVMFQSTRGLDGPRDAPAAGTGGGSACFNPRAGWMARATPTTANLVISYLFQSTRGLDGPRDGSWTRSSGLVVVSIHARAGWPARPGAW